MSLTDEIELTEDDVRREHTEAVDAARHWAYLAVVLIGALVLMLLLIALLGSTTG
jgi:TRAP-type C4-dicarboxylate transport system permease small subunit